MEEGEEERVDDDGESVFEKCWLEAAREGWVGRRGQGQGLRPEDEVLAVEEDTLELVMVVPEPSFGLLGVDILKSMIRQSVLSMDGWMKKKERRETKRRNYSSSI